METKVCPKCKVEKLNTDFHKCKKNKDGLYYSCKQCRKEYAEENKDNIINYNKNYYISNLDYQLKRKKEYRENNKETIKIYYNIYKQSRINNDPLFKFITKIRKIIHNSLKAKSDRKDTKIYQILGCTSNEFKLHLESQFQPWMNWNNRGLYNGKPNYGWDIDHIISMSSAKTEEDVIKLNHYTNLRPRCSYLNRVEDNRKYKTNT